LICNGQLPETGTGWGQVNNMVTFLAYPWNDQHATQIDLAKTDNIQQTQSITGHWLIPAAQLHLQNTVGFTTLS